MTDRADASGPVTADENDVIAPTIHIRAVRVILPSGTRYFSNAGAAYAFLKSCGSIDDRLI